MRVESRGHHVSVVFLSKYVKQDSVQFDCARIPWIRFETNQQNYRNYFSRSAYFTRISFNETAFDKTEKHVLQSKFILG